VVLSEIAARVGGLHDHFLALDGAGCECQSAQAMLDLDVSSDEGESLLVASTAPRTLSSTRKFDSSEAICQVVVDGPWALIRAHICGTAALASVLRGHVGERVIGLVAALDGLVDGSFAGPST
jgi:hypothetical protein